MLDHEENRLSAAYNAAVKQYSALVSKMTDLGMALPRVEYDALHFQVEYARRQCEAVRFALLSARAERPNPEPSSSTWRGSPTA